MGDDIAHLFINRHTAVRIRPVARTWVSRTIGIPAKTIRHDRILHEALATGGDVRRLCDLFGLTVGGAIRYTDPVNPPNGSDTTPGTEAQT